MLGLVKIIGGPIATPHCSLQSSTTMLTPISEVIDVI